MLHFPKSKSKFAYQFLLSGLVLSFLTYAFYSWQCTSTWNSDFPTTPVAFPHYSHTLESIFDGGKDTKLILFYTTIFGHKDRGLAAWWLTNRTFEECPYKCGVTTNRSLKDSSDALVFHAEDERDVRLPLRYSASRPDQIWIFFLLESPVSAGWLDFKKYNGLINWTMTYRSDSDVQWPYGRFIRTPTANKIPRLESIRNKTGLVATMISNCETGSGRQNLIKYLQRHVRVDYYGKCGNLTCDRNRNCYKELAEKYKFWLSFENSACDDYVTEKFFKPLEYGAVPVVYGGANYSLLFPNNSFINALDFRSVKELADHLLYLDQHPSEYLKYFAWKKEFEILTSTVASTYCDLCTKLHITNFTSTRKYYKDIPSWFRKSSYKNGPGCKKAKKALP